jgi:hypothetical protein
MPGTVKGRKIYIQVQALHGWGCNIPLSLFSPLVPRRDKKSAGIERLFQCLSLFGNAANISSVLTNAILKMEAPHGQ